LKIIILSSPHYPYFWAA